MLVLDENLPAGQRHWLRRWRIHFRVVGVDLARRGTDDENVIPLLHRLRGSTFFTLDRDFYDRALAHGNYSLVWLDVEDDRSAEFIRRFLRHPAFNTTAKRMGLVARVHADGVLSWRAGKRSPQSISWTLQ